jgi:hypothetical protein
MHEIKVLEKEEKNIQKITKIVPIFTKKVKKPQRSEKVNTVGTRKKENTWQIIIKLMNIRGKSYKWACKKVIQKTKDQK